MLDSLRRIAEHLRSHRVAYADKIESVSNQIRHTETSSLSPDELESVMGLFGGMGSLNDVYISRRNGHVVDDEAEANRRLDLLREELWQELRRIGG